MKVEIRIQRNRERANRLRVSGPPGIEQINARLKGRVDKECADRLAKTQARNAREQARVEKTCAARIERLNKKIADLEEFEKTVVKWVFFDVSIPDPDDANITMSRKLRVKVPVKFENGIEILTPEAHQIIADAREKEMKRINTLRGVCPISSMVKVSKEFFKEAQQTNIDPIAELLPKP